MMNHFLLFLMILCGEGFLSLSSSFSLSESTCKYTELVRAKLLNPEADVRLSSVRISPTF